MKQRCAELIVGRGQGNFTKKGLRLHANIGIFVRVFCQVADVILKTGILRESRELAASEANSALSRAKHALKPGGVTSSDATTVTCSERSDLASKDLVHLEVVSSCEERSLVGPESEIADFARVTVERIIKASTCRIHHLATARRESGLPPHLSLGPLSYPFRFELFWSDASEGSHSEEVYPALDTPGHQDAFSP